MRKILPTIMMRYVHVSLQPGDGLAGVQELMRAVRKLPVILSYSFCPRRDRGKRWSLGRCVVPTLQHKVVPVKKKQNKPKQVKPTLQHKVIPVKKKQNKPKQQQQKKKQKKKANQNGVVKYDAVPKA